MKTKTSLNLRLLIVFSLLFAAIAVALPVVAAQGSEGSGGQGGGAGEQDQDRIQDPTTHDGMEPDQDREQTLDQATQNGTEPEQNQNQNQNQTRDGDQVRAVGTATALRNFVDEQNQDRMRLENTATSGQGMMTEERVRAEVATEAFIAAEEMLGPNGPRMSEVAQEVNQAMHGLAVREEALQDRGAIRNFFFGQDQEQVQLMQQEMEQNRDRLEELKQLLKDCDDCDQETIQLLVEQHQMLEQEQNRVQTVVQEAAGKRGIFGFLFGWIGS